jgi:hypothetical protein
MFNAINIFTRIIYIKLGSLKWSMLQKFFP